MAAGAGADKVLTTDASGVATWQEAAGGGIASDLNCVGCVSETEIAQNTLDDSEIEDNSLTAGSLAANSCGDSELIDIPTFTTVNISSVPSYDKLRVWGSDLYTIGMTSAQTYGGLNDYAMTFTMNPDADRGFLWRDSSDAASDGAMSLTTSGVLTVKGTVTAPQFIGGGAGITSPVSIYCSGSWIEVGTYDYELANGVQDATGNLWTLESDGYVYKNGTRYIKELVQYNNPQLGGYYIRSEAYGTQPLERYCIACKGGIYHSYGWGANNPAYSCYQAKLDGSCGCESAGYAGKPYHSWVKCALFCTQIRW